MVADGLSKDVVGARISLDISKITPAFKSIDQDIQRNAQSFKTLNAELIVAEKNYTSLAKAMDKTSLTADERRKKIMDESNALVAQRKAQTELLQAKTAGLDKSNQVTEQKLKAQEAIVKRRNDAIEQQEREHQRRMDVLQNRASAAGSHDNVLQARLDREFQLMRNAQIRLEQQTREHQARMDRLNNQTTYSDPITAANTGGLMDKLKNAAIHATIFHGVYRAMHVAQEALKEGLVGIEANMAGYVQTNEHYFVEFNKGTGEMIMNTERLHSETTKFIQTAHALGAEVMDVTESARLWGRMYKDAGIVQELVRQSTQLSVVDMVELEDATKGMESVMAQYGVQIKDVNDAMVIGNRVLDSWSKVAHDTMAPAQDLAAAFQRTGKIADETGVSFDVMNGLIAAGVRNTALGGANLGNMWKTVLGTIRTDKAVAEIEKLGVATKEVVDGKEEWRRADDILIELSTKVIDKNYDLTQSYADISRGVYQYAKLAASLNAGDILLGTAASIGSTGSTMEYLMVQMDTIQRKASQTRTSLLEIFNKAGDDGLRRAIKNSLDILDQLLIGLTKLPKGAVAGTAALLALFGVYKMAVPLLAQWKLAQANLATAMQMYSVIQNKATIDMVAYTAAARSAMMVTAAWTVGITLLVGAIAMFVFMSGKAEKAERDSIQRMKDEESAMQQRISQYERQIELLPKLVNAHNSLQASLDAGTISNEKQAKVKKQLDDISHALRITLGEEGAAQLEAANYTDEAVRIQVDALNLLIEKQNEARRNVLLDQQEVVEKQLSDKLKDLEDAKKSLDAAKNSMMVVIGGQVVNQADLIESTTNVVKKLQSEYNILAEAAGGVGMKIAELEVERIDQLAGASGKASEGVEDLDDKVSRLNQELNDAESNISDLNGVLADLTAGKSLNAQAVTELINKYPELASKVSRTKDGWIIEKGAIDDVRIAQIDLAVKTVQAQNTMSSAVLMQSSDRIDKYGIEIEKIIDVQSAMTELSKLPFGPMTVDDAALSEAVLTAGRKAEETKKLFKSLYSDPGYGMSSDSKSKKADKKDPLKDAFEEFRKRIDHLRAMGQLSTQQELEEWKKAQTAYAARLELRWQADEKVYALQAKLIEEKEKKEKDSFSASEKFISHKKAMGEMSLSDELAAWERVQARYRAGTEERMKADEQVYALKKSLVQDEEKNLDKIMKKETDYLKESKQAAIKKIEEERDAYVSATDDKIREIDRLIAAEQDANDEEDYERKLAEKQARLALLESAVGPEGIKERRDVTKEIEDMQRDHQRVLRKQDLEGQKKTLEEEKRVKEEAWKQEKKDIEKRYDDLLKAFEEFSNDTINQAELLKRIQIMKESEKNAEILKQLDTFVSQYQSKMASIASLSRTQAEIDFEKYTENQRIWNDPNSSTAQKNTANSANIAYRNQYGISQTDYLGLQHFADGGVVQGNRGSAVPVVAHGGEMYINERQQDNLFRLLDFRMPSINFKAPSFAMASGQNQSVMNKNYYTVSTGNVTLGDDADIRTFWGERDGMVRRFQSRSGAKTR
jgi:TP901 family phage tail tape measure protein